MADDDSNARHIVRKVYTPPPPPQAATTMTPAQSEGWNDWCHEHVMRGIEIYSEATGEAFAHERRAVREHVAAAVKELNAEIVELKVQLAYLRGARSAEVIDLPALPSRKKLNAA
jgi:hypothetical protein